MPAAEPACADVVVLGTRDIVQFRNGRTVKGIVEEPNYTIHATTADRRDPARVGRRRHAAAPLNSWRGPI